MNQFRHIATVVMSLLAFASYAQPTHFYTHPERDFENAKALFNQGQYALAYTEFAALAHNLDESHKTDKSYYYDQVNYYHIVCELQLMLDIAGPDAMAFVKDVNNEALRHLMCFYLGHYLYQKAEYEQSIEYFTQARFDNLTNDQIADAKFEQAYCYFQLKDYDKARKLFNEIHQLPNHKYYVDANYYYGFICYMQHDYEAALDCFRLIASNEKYNSTVPYYIAEILYATGKKTEALKYGDSVLAQNGASTYKKELQLLTGQLYFERNDFKAALPLFEDYAHQNNKVSKQVMYELSFCYYKDNQVAKAVEGFKQLSNEKDSMGQNSMYLLGELYLKQNDKSNARTAFHYCSYNNSNPEQQRVSRLNYAKLSYEIGFNDIALNEIKAYIRDYQDYNNNGKEGNAKSDLSEAKELMIDMLANTNNYDEGLALFGTLQQSSAAAQKSYARLLFGKSIQLLNEQREDDAAASLSKIIALKVSTPVAPFASFWLGEISYRQRRYDDAIRFLKDFTSSHAPALGEANQLNASYNIGYSWFQKADYKQALNHFSAVAASVKSGSSSVEQDAYLRSADCHYMNRNYKDAIRYYDDVIALKFPQADYALFQKAMIAGISDTKSKIKMLTDLAKNYPKSNLLTDAQMEAANTCIADEKYADAIPYLNLIINNPAAASRKPQAYLKLGLVYFNMNDNKNALVYYKLLLTQYPQSAETDEAVAVLKDIYLEEGRPDDYFELMQANGIVVKITEADSLSYTSARIKYDAGDIDGAIAGFDNYLNKYKNGAYLLEAAYAKGKCHQQKKEFVKAMTAYLIVHNMGNSKYFESATLEMARICYIEQKDYIQAKKYFEILSNQATNPEIRQDALRGLVRSNYQLKDYSLALQSAKELAAMKGSSTDDKAVANLVQGKALLASGDSTASVEAFKAAAQSSKTSWGAEARYEIALDALRKNDLKAAEKNAMMVIDNYGAYEMWVARAYIVLGDIFMRQKDYFNAKATYESVLKNTTLAEVKQEAQQKFDAALAAEKQSSKISN